MDYEVPFYKKINDKFQCGICPHNCIISEGHFGVCRIRGVKEGKLVATNFGEVTSVAIDPIEKKPLYHFKPSKSIFSVGSYGCNMTCSFCQNYEISQNRPRSEYIDVNKIISLCNEIDENVGIAFTYNEPLMWYEYVYEVAKKMKETNSDKSVVLVTNGYINEEPMRRLLPYIDAMNIDLKAYSNKFYNKICGASLEPILETIKICSEKTHVEITTLLVSDENDSIEEVSEIAQFISSINKDIPLHLSRYFPRYKMELEETSISRMLEARVEARKYLNYVYLGNVPNEYNNINSCK